MDTSPAVDMWTVEIDGVAGFWVPAPGPLSVALVFGVGVNDEQLTHRGINHLIEHLCLFGLDHRRVDFNGHVTGATTAFTATGTLDEVQSVLDHACRSLAELPIDRLDSERRVLRTEAQSRGSSVIGAHLDIRYGPNGAGLIDADELGLRWLRPDHLADWAGRWFTTGNAVLAASGRDPRALRLHVPLGPAPARSAAPTDLIDRPMWTDLGANVVALSAPGPRNPETAVAYSLLGAVAERRLREVDGRSYSIVETTIDVGPELVCNYLGADCLHGEATAVREALSSELAKLRTHGPTDADLEAAKHAITRAATDERASLAHAYKAAEAHLSGRQVATPAARLARHLAVTADDVATVFQLDQARMLWTVPYGSGFADHRFTLVPGGSTDTISGVEYQRGAGSDIDRVDDRLIVGADGILIRVAADQAAAIRWHDVRAACRFDDRSWILHGTDGIVLRVRARDWFKGDEALRELEHRTPPSTVVEMGETLSNDPPDTDPTGPLLAPKATKTRKAGKAGKKEKPPNQAKAPGPAWPAPAPGATLPPARGHVQISSSGLIALVVVWIVAMGLAAYALAGVPTESNPAARGKVAIAALAGAAYLTRVLLARRR